MTCSYPLASTESQIIMPLTAIAAILLTATPRPPLAMPKAEVERARQLEQQASELQRAGRYMDAERPLLDAIALWTSYHGPDDIEVLNDTMNLAVAYRRHGATERAVPLLERASKGFATCADPDAPALRRKALNNLAAAYRFANKSQEARSTWEALLIGPGPQLKNGRVLTTLVFYWANPETFAE